MSATRRTDPPTAQTDEFPQLESVEYTPAIHRVERRRFGIPPLPLLASTWSLALVLAILLLAGGAWAAGLVALVLVVALGALLAEAVREHPEAPVARELLEAGRRARSLGHYSAALLATWFRGAVALLRIRSRRRSLREALDNRLQPLGEAVYRDDHARAEAIKREAAQIEDALRRTEREEAAVRAAVRRTAEREQAVVQPTEPLPRVEAPR